VPERRGVECGARLGVSGTRECGTTMERWTRVVYLGAREEVFNDLITEGYPVMNTG